MFACAGFALIPLLAHSASGENAHSAPLRIVALGDDRVKSTEIRLRTDPFARALPGTSQARGGRISRPEKKFNVRVLAIVLANTPHALLSNDDGSTRIVGPGDSIDGLRVAAIVDGAVVLSNGRRLSLSEKSP